MRRARRTDTGSGATRVSTVLAMDLVVLIVENLSAARANARPWKPTSAMLARDYANIVDIRTSKHETVFVIWSVPPGVTSARLQEALDKYVVISVAHAKIAADGTSSFDMAETPQARDGNSQPLALLSGDKVPPVIAGYVATYGGMMRQSAGPFGQGMRSYVFTGGSAHACEKGRLSVRYADETYTYETPIPGCPQK